MTCAPQHSVGLCLLDPNPDECGLNEAKASLSCLRNHPGVRVVLIRWQAPDHTQVLQRFVDGQYGNEVKILTREGFALLSRERAGSGAPAYFIFLSPGDWLSDQALGKISAVAGEKQPDIIYTDEDSISDDGHLAAPLFKPDPSPEFFLHSDYVGALLCIKRSTLASYGGIDVARYADERYRLVLHAFSSGGSIAHLAEPLHHSRLGAQKRATGALSVLKRHCKDRGMDVKVEQINGNAYRIRHKITGHPKVSIVIPFKDKPELLKQCLHAVSSRTDYGNFEVIGVSNRSQSIAVYEVMRKFAAQDQRFRFMEYNIPFNFSALVNFGVTQADGEFIVLMNNDIAVINTDWLQAMLEHGQHERTGVVGAKLLYPNNTIQHAGIAIQQSGYIAHLHKHYPAEAKGYMNRLICVQNVSAVTGALCLFRKELHQQLNGFDEERFKVAFNDVDFCLRAEALGYSNIFTPHAVAYHHESLSRGYETSEQKKQRFWEEQRHFASLYAQRLSRGDPYYNPNLNQNRDDFSY